MPLPVYMLLGPEKGRKEEFLGKLKKSLGECEVSRFYGFDDYEGEMFAQLMNNDLFCAHRLVILDSAEEVRTADKVKPLVRYIEAPSANVTFVLISNELYLNSSLMNAMKDPKESVLKFYEMFENQKEQWLREFFRSNGLTISSQAIEAIMERVDNNISEFRNVCSQIVVYMGTCRGTSAARRNVEYQDIEDFLAHTRQETEFTLFAHIAAGKTDSALECLKALINTSDSWQVTGLLVLRLAGYFRRLYSIHKCIQDGKTVDDALKGKYFDTDRAVTMPKDKAIYKAAQQRYSLRDVQRILAMLAEYDIAVKEAGSAVQQTVLELCILRILKDRGAGMPELEFASL